MIQFTYQYDKSSPKVTVRLPSDSGLADVLQQFEGFLKAAGYSFDGQLDFIEEEQKEPANA